MALSDGDDTETQTHVNGSIRQAIRSASLWEKPSALIPEREEEDG